MNNISKEYLINILKNGKRVDSRKLDELRDVEISYDVSKNAEGSARVKIGNTEVIAGVKLEVGTPFPDSPDKGVIMVGAETLPLSSPDFESGPPDVKSIELARVVDRAIRESHAIDLGKLCIEEKEKVWMVLIDIYSINDDGNLQDAAALAALAALKKTKMPGFDGDKVSYKERKGSLPIKELPVECTNIKVGDKILSDPNLDEENWLDARLTVATTEKGEICAMQKGGNGVLTINDIKEMIKISLKNGKILREKLK